MNEYQKERLKNAFRDYLPLRPDLEPHLKAALDHVLDNPGSLVRPEIVFEVALGYRMEETTATDLAIALEYFHTASLIFDDLPSMDNAIERRGSSCVHIEFGDAGAMLTALALINRAYLLLWRAVSKSSPDRQAQALTYVEARLGVDGLLDGQSMDLNYASLPYGRETAEKIAIGKTVALIRLTLVLPALLGGASAVELRLLERLAFFWGLSYQIADDLKDVLQNSSKSGKTGSRDMLLGRPNTALVLGVGATAERLLRLIELGDKMLARLIVLKPGVSFLETLRVQLGEEAVRITQSLCEPAGGRS